MLLRLSRSVDVPSDVERLVGIGEIALIAVVQKDIVDISWQHRNFVGSPRHAFAHPSSSCYVFNDLIVAGLSF